jgi:uncharacterized membrane protein
MSSAPSLPSTTMRNVELIALVEQQLLDRRSRAERTGEVVARFFGSFRFIAAHTGFFLFWILLNSVILPAAIRFDPYPFPFLSLLVGIEFILLTTFVLMNQDNQMRRTEQWSLLTLQMCLLAEQEGTASIEMLHRVCQHLGLEKPLLDQEVKELAQATDVVALAEEISKAREVGEEVVEELEKVREVEETLVEEIEKACETEAVGAGS